MVLLWTKLNPIHLRMLCAKFGWNWLSGSAEEDFLISSMYFRYFWIISPWKRAGPFICTNLNPLCSRMYFAKFGWNWPSGSWEQVENRKSLQTNGQTDRQTDDSRKAIRKAHLSFQLRWAKNQNTCITNVMKNRYSCKPNFRLKKLSEQVYSEKYSMHDFYLKVQKKNLICNKDRIWFYLPGK